LSEPAMARAYRMWNDSWFAAAARGGPWDCLEGTCTEGITVRGRPHPWVITASERFGRLPISTCSSAPSGRGKRRTSPHRSCRGVRPAFGSTSHRAARPPQPNSVGPTAPASRAVKPSHPGRYAARRSPNGAGGGTVSRSDVSAGADRARGSGSDSAHRQTSRPTPTHSVTANIPVNHMRPSPNSGTGAPGVYSRRFQQRRRSSSRITCRQCEGSEDRGARAVETRTLDR